MPYCEKHNEVYRSEECPICRESGEGDTSPDSGADEVGDGESAVDADDLVSDALDSVTSSGESVDGDVVIGSQEKNVEDRSVTDIDESTVVTDESEEVHDESSTISDSVVSGPSGERDGPSSDVNAGGVSGRSTERGRDERSRRDPKQDRGPDAGPETTSTTSDSVSEDATQFCIYCGAEFPADVRRCPECGEEV